MIMNTFSKTKQKRSRKKDFQALLKLKVLQNETSNFKSSVTYLHIQIKVYQQVPRNLVQSHVVLY